MTSPGFGIARGVFTDDLTLQSLTLPLLTPPTAGMAKVALSITPSAVATATVVEQTFTVTGVEVGDAVSVSPPGVTAGVGIGGARVSAANTVAIQFINPTAGSVTPKSGVHIFTIVR